MPRRIHVHVLHSGLLSLDPGEAHHAAQVLRLADGDLVEVFDDAGNTADAMVRRPAGEAVSLEVTTVRPPIETRFRWHVAAAVPKGERADWMVEKLSELGCASFTPLMVERSVVVPKGTGKHERWVRLATESAKQCRRPGVMAIQPLIELPRLFATQQIDSNRRCWFLEPAATAVPIYQMLHADQPPADLTLMAGPEGGWTPAEVDRMLDSQWTSVSLTDTILRMETAVIAAAACVATRWTRGAMQTLQGTPSPRDLLRGALT